MVIKRAIHKYGKDNFIIETVEECDQQLLNEREIYWISYYNSYETGYNSTLGGQEYTKMPKLIKKSAEIIELYNEGFSLRTIAKEYNVDHATIKSLLTRNNISLRDTRTYKFSKLQRQQIIEEVNKGASRKDIMQKFHISKGYLSQLLNSKRRI